MMEQASRFRSSGLTTEFVGSAQTSPSVCRSVERGEVQLVFITPESLIGTYRDMLLTPAYKDKLVAVAVDEAHLVKEWGEKFRTAFSQIGNLRSLMPNGVNAMGLTATATTETYSAVCSKLAMTDPAIVAMSPHRENIVFRVSPKIEEEKFLESLCQELQEKTVAFPKTVVYVRRQIKCADLHMLLKGKLGRHYTSPPGYPSHCKYRLIDMFSAAQTQEKRAEVLDVFCQRNSKLRLLFATVAFGMGVDCPDIRRIIHWGIPDSLECYAQETGRAGRDKKQSEAILYRGVGGTGCRKVKMYVANDTSCRRRILFKDFMLFSESSVSVQGCKCCDVCSKVCNCKSCS